MVFTSRNWFAMQGPVAIILISWNVIFIWETGYWTRAIKRFALFDLLKSFATGPCIANQLRDVNTICRRSWYIAAHVWKIYDFKIEVVPLIINFSTSFHQRSLISVFRIWFNVYLLTSYMTRVGSQMKYISMKNSQFFNYLLYAKSK
jgi:hypothetical protein